MLRERHLNIVTCAKDKRGFGEDRAQYISQEGLAEDCEDDVGETEDDNENMMISVSCMMITT